MASREVLHALGRRVRTLRGEKGWTRRELCSQSGVSERYLAEIEQGRGNPSVLSLVEIAEALETSAAALLTPQPEVVALLGLRGAGKSTVGRALARRKKVTFVELDARVEKAAGMSLSALFEMHGETYFRRVEREVLGSFLAAAPRAVLATGGGLVTDRESFELLRRQSITVWLRARPEVHWSRVLAQGDSRPMGNDPRAMQRLRELLEEREPLYRRAHHVVDVSERDVQGVVTEIERLIA